MAKSKRAVTEYRSYYLPTHFPVLLLSGDYWKISDIPSGSLHFHNCLEIGICHSDSGTLEINGEKQTFHAGDVTVLPRNVPHTTYSAPGTKSHWSYLFLDPKELFRNLLPASWKNYDLSTDGFPAFRYIFSKEAFPHINYLVSHIIHELEEQNPCYQISARSLLCSLYIELYRIESLGVVNPDTAKPDSLDILALQERKKEGEIAENSLVISPALEYIEKNYMQQFSIEYLADLCHWSPTHFRRVFHDIMGTSPLDYVNNTRILKSCILLRSTEHSILDISEMVGFHSVSSFNRYFIKLMQMSPMIFRVQLMSLFLDAGESAEAIGIGCTYLTIIGVAYVIAGVMQSYQNVIRGAGDVNTCMVAGLTELSGRIVFAYLLSGTLGVTGIWIATPLSWSCGCVIPVIRYYSGKWKHKRLA